MFELETDRLYLQETPLHVIEARLKQDEFDVELRIGGQARQVHFPAEWPGDALDHFPGMAQHLRHAPGAESWGGTLIEKEGLIAVGQLGTKGPPDSAGAVDIGYGLNASFEGRGYMTEAVQGFAGWLLAQQGVRRVTADCLESNVGSVRVLEKAGFVRLSERYDVDEGGLLVFWERAR